MTEKLKTISPVFLYFNRFFKNMKWRGPKTVFISEDKYQECLKHDIFKEDKITLKGQSDPVWQIICNALNEKQNPSIKLIPVRMYAYVHKDSDGIIKKLLQEKFPTGDGSSSGPLILSTLGILNNSSGNFIPIAQISSDCHSKLNIYRFLFEIIRTGLKIPNSIKLDHVFDYFLANSCFKAGSSLETNFHKRMYTVPGKNLIFV